MSNAKTPTLNKTPFRRLGLARRIKRTSVDFSSSTNTPTSTLTTTAVSNASPANVSSLDTQPMRPIKSTCSIDASDSEDDDVSTPVTPVNTKSIISKKTRLSLSQSWRNKITHKKQMQNVKRRKLLGEVEQCSEPTTSEDNAENNDHILPKLEGPSPKSEDGSKPSSVRQRIEEVKESINVWRVGCVQALNDLQERRQSGDMESLLNSLQIPFDLINYDRENQEFLDPD